MSRSYQIKDIKGTCLIKGSKEIEDLTNRLRKFVSLKIIVLKPS